MTDTRGSADRQLSLPVLGVDIKAFREADSDAQRAGVLLGAPIGTLLKWREVFERYARAVAFSDGLAYLAALADASRRRRHLGVMSTTELEGAKTKLLFVLDRGAS